MDQPTGKDSRNLSGTSLVPTDASPIGCADLVAGIRKGDESTVREFHRLYHARLTRYALVVCRGNEAAAADAVQLAFLKAMRAPPRIKDADALWAWLARACRSSATDQHRSARRYSTLLARFAESLIAPAAPTPIDAETIWHDALARALQSLDDGERALLEHRYSLHTPLATIAATAGTTERAIEGRLARLREKLRSLILRDLATQPDENERPPR